MIKQTLVCDFCRSNIEQQKMRSTNYISITTNALEPIGPEVYMIGELALVPNRDFCSKPCLAAWSAENA